ncbi:hypothetical protein G7Y89_g13464 [Cudoniella acicularis]|uniref:Centromere protein I n=1 Tax=Cudoniella acicularis TaxID=354080 RepID=A0A8H4R9K0_9HELO|nr:hypothetical protein G7Y89_g13464 [Cudoniella acicularis]
MAPAVSPDHDRDRDRDRDRDSRIGELLEHLKHLEHAAKIPAKQRALKISAQVDRVCTSAYENGLPDASLNKVIDIITLPNELDQASINSLIRNLYPASKVLDVVVIKIVNSLGHGRAKLSFSAQAALLKWLVMIYDILDNQKVLSQLYGILFNLLDTVAIRMELTRRAGNEPPLVGLMRVFKDYYPDIIVGDAVSGRASVFTHPNPEWREHLGEIQATHYQRTQDGLPPEKRTFRVARKGPNGGKYARNPAIPGVHTLNAQESSITLEEIEDVHDFVQRLENIEPPNQLVAVIGDPLLQKFLQLRSSEIYSRRVDTWLLAFFEDQLESTNPSETKMLEMLEAVRGYTQYTKILPAACFTYLKSMIYSWNGIASRKVILDLLSFTPIAPFEELYSITFQPLEAAVLEDGSIESKLALLDFYRNLLDHWTLSLLARPEPSPIATPAITSLATHANMLATTIAQTSQSIIALSCVLDFYESLTSLISQQSLKDIIHIPIPPAELIYTLHFTQSLNIVSRLCGILARYKRAFEASMGSKVQHYAKDYLNHFNGFLMDICNCIWKARAFNTSDTNAVGCLLNENVVSRLDHYTKALGNPLSLSTIFSLSFSPVFCLLAITYVRELEDAAEDEILCRHPGPVTQISLKQLEKDGGIILSWPDYKLGLLCFLEDKGVHGIGKLMYSTLKQLMTARQQRG